MRMVLAAMALALAGCTSAGRPEGSPLQGIAAFTLRAPGTGGRAAAPGAVRSTEGRPVSPGVGLSLDLLPERWIGSFRSESLALPGEIEPAGARAASLQSLEVAAGPKILGTGGVRLDALAGGRAWLLRSTESIGDVPSEDIDREAWVEPFAGLRADIAAFESVSLRIRGEGSLVPSDRVRSWRASAAGVFAISTAVSLSIGWETSSAQLDRGSGGNRFLVDASLSGPFLAVELRF